MALGLDHTMTVQGPMTSKDIRVKTGEIKSSKIEICHNVTNNSGINYLIILNIYCVLGCII